MKRSSLFILSLFLVFNLTGCLKEEMNREERVASLGKQLRCPVCRGVPISDSPSELATQMMQIVREQVDQGRDDREILKYFEERYGEWALLQPKAEGMNLTIWILPAVFLSGGAILIIMTARKRTKMGEKI